ncbi:MAG: replicative DNA helicase [Bacilli bacterium]|nr:replicative DNA helicase [Bacilli bacterium]
MDYPFSDQAEKAVLGTMMIEDEAVLVGCATLSDEDFFVDANRQVFKAIFNLHNKKTPVDITTVTDELINTNELENVGGVSFLATLIDGVLKSNMDYYISILKDKTNLRNLIKLFEKELNDLEKNGVGDVAEYLNEIEKEVLTITRNRRVGEFKSTQDIVKVLQEKFFRGSHNKNKVKGVMSGFYDLDKMTNGWQPGDLIILAARPSMGKSTLALNFAVNAARYSKVPVAFFSLEMTAEQLVERIVSFTAHVQLKKIRTLEFDDDDLVKFEDGAKKVSNLPIYIDDTPGARLSDVQAKTRKLKSLRSDLGLIVIDYLGLITTGGKYKNDRQQEVAEISRTLKALAREVNVPIIVLSQLSRQAEQRKGDDKRPILADLRDSGAIEQDADMVLFIYREDYYSNEKEEKEKPQVKAEILLSKNRQGPTGIVDVMFAKQYTEFNNINNK